MHLFEDRLWVPAVDSVHFTLNHQISRGWTMHVAHRHSGEDWLTCPPDHYDFLASEELPGLVDIALCDLLGL